jgi:hypothetical protein
LRQASQTLSSPYQQGQLCDLPFSVSGEIGSVLQVQYFVRSTHCSSLRVHLFVDGTLKVTTGFLGWPGAPSPFAELPLGTGLVDLGPVSPGAHLISVQAEGQVSGCPADPRTRAARGHRHDSTHAGGHPRAGRCGRLPWLSTGPGPDNTGPRAPRPRVSQRFGSVLAEGARNCPRRRRRPLRHRGCAARPRG